MKPDAELMSPADSYRILELSMSASHGEVKAAYHRLVLQWHPDRFHDDPVNHPIAEKKIREINRAYDVLSKSGVDQRDADELSEDSADTYRSGSASFQSRKDDVFYTNLEEAIRSGTSKFAGSPQNFSVDDAFACQPSATESKSRGRASCAYVGGDPRLEHLSSGFLGSSVIASWNSTGVKLSTSRAAIVAYPAHSIRSVRLARRSSLAFLSESTVRIQVTNPDGIATDNFLIKLRFRDRSTAEFFASQIGKTFSVATKLESNWFQAATLLMLLVVLAGLGISIGLNAKRSQSATDSTKLKDHPVVAINKDRGKDESKASIAPVVQQAVAQTDADVQSDAVAAIERSGGSVYESQGKVVLIKLAGARVDASLLTHISGLKDLEELNLHASTITGEEFRYLSELSSLRVLDLDSTQNASVGVQYLMGLTRLQTLCLSNTDISDAELQLLENLPELQEVELISTQVTEIGVDQFIASRPDCLVVK